MKNLQAELQNTLTALQQQDPSDLLDDEKVAVMITVGFGICHLKLPLNFLEYLQILFTKTSLALSELWCTNASVKRSDD